MTRLVDRIIGAPWLIHGPALQTIIEIASREPVDAANVAEWKRLLAPATDALDLRQAAPMPGARRAQMRDGVAILRIGGPIYRHASLMTEMSGATALADFGVDLALARDDTRVRGIALAIDSPGGEVTGIAEAAQAIREAAGVKPVAAFIEGLGASAAYWLASAAGEIVMSPTAMVGSLGAVVGITDRTGRDQRDGVKRHEFVSSQTPGKRADPNTDAGRAAWQRMADDVAAVFLDAAAAYRNTSVEALLDATEGGGMIIAHKAVAAGMADRVGTFEDTIARLASGETAAPARAARPAAYPAPSTRAQESAMPDPAADTTPASTAADAPALAPAPVADPTPAAPPAHIDAAAAERARCAAIMTAQQPHGRALAALAIEAGWPAEQFVRAQAAAADGARAAAAEQFRGSLPAPVTAAAPAPQTPEEKAKADWDSDSKLRAEFGGNFGAYSGWLKHGATARRIAPRAA